MLGGVQIFLQLVCCLLTTELVGDRKYEVALLTAPNNCETVLFKSVSCHDRHRHLGRAVCAGSFEAIVYDAELLHRAVRKSFFPGATKL